MNMRGFNNREREVIIILKLKKKHKIAKPEY